MGNPISPSVVSPYPGGSLLDAKGLQGTQAVDITKFNEVVSTALGNGKPVKFTIDTAGITQAKAQQALGKLFQDNSPLLGLTPKQAAGALGAPGLEKMLTDFATKQGIALQKGDDGKGPEKSIRELVAEIAPKVAGGIAQNEVLPAVLRTLEKKLGPDGVKAAGAAGIGFLAATNPSLLASLGLEAKVSLLKGDDGTLTAAVRVIAPGGNLGLEGEFSGTLKLGRTSNVSGQISVDTTGMTKGSVNAQGSLGDKVTFNVNASGGTTDPFQINASLAKGFLIGSSLSVTPNVNWSTGNGVKLGVEANYPVTRNLNVGASFAPDGNSVYLKYTNGNP